MGAVYRLFKELPLNPVTDSDYKGIYVLERPAHVAYTPKRVYGLTINEIVEKCSSSSIKFQSGDTLETINSPIIQVPFESNSNAASMRIKVSENELADFYKLLEKRKDIFSVE